MPPKVKNYENMLRPVVDQLAKHAPGGEPIRVYNAATGEHEEWFLVLAFNMNDIRAVPIGTCGKNPPCITGSCNACDVCGQYHRKTTVVPGAVRLLTPGKRMVYPVLRAYNTIMYGV